MVNYTTKGNKNLNTYGIKNPVPTGELIKMSEEYKEATSGDVVKFKNEGDSVEGVYQGYEESKQYPDSYALKIKVGEDLKVVFVSGIVIDLIESNSVMKGQDVKLEYTGKKKSEKTGRNYNTYKLLYK